MNKKHNQSKLPPEVLEIISILRSPNYTNRRLELLRDLDGFQSKELIVHILYLAFDDDEELAREAGRMIEVRLKGTNAYELIKLDNDIRHGPYYYGAFQSGRIYNLYPYPNPTPL